VVAVEAPTKERSIVQVPSLAVSVLPCLGFHCAGRSESLAPDSHIEVPEDNYGLYSCDLLDPDLVRTSLDHDRQLPSLVSGKRRHNWQRVFWSRDSCGSL